MTEYLNEALSCLGSGGKIIDFDGSSYKIDDYSGVLVYNVANATATTPDECATDVSFTVKVTLINLIKGKPKKGGSLIMGKFHMKNNIGECGGTGCSQNPLLRENGGFRRRLGQTIDACQNSIFLSKMKENGFGMINAMQFKEITIL
eukprot:CAMPEP_0185729616 /NCGR_PEP_ID=MMETSP1171-20130828/6594_1 /TAXON_ID=374046 /ORGANISM="Helicotheca tamensis, Strain CCMP826" /LENGTH=146 /DNA_ID=CAMNT_0028398497 /DNA_START=207 /DNA_END=647 /DNA_ORIENTATION=+